VWAADYVLPDYGTGAIMAVPAHDQRDLDFARAYGLNVRVVVDTGLPDPAQTWVATPGDGRLVNSGPLDGMAKAEAIAAITAILEDQGQGHAAVNYRLRDWLVSRQRFWGTPIPIIHCPSAARCRYPTTSSRWSCPTCAARTWCPAASRRWPAAEDWVNVACPACASRPSGTRTPWTRSWTPPGTCSGTVRPATTAGPFDAAEVRRWAPVDMYVGGVEHAILHLLYSRFFTKILYDMGLIDFTEPFTRLINQGQVINQGKAMSKSLGKRRRPRPAARAVRRGRDPAYDDLRQPAGR